MAIEKTVYDNREKRNGNVIPIPPNPNAPPWYEKDGIGSLKLSSVDEYSLAMDYWLDQWEKHPFKNEFKTLKDFISWSITNGNK